jgi:hypothetical protein|tara:strand:+ start:508 stop:756 length:249 start_codon:yes stop_codon:yes gene_type:complete
MKEKNTDELKIDVPEDRGTLDLTRQIDELRQTIKGYEFLLDVLKKEIFEAKKISSENEKNKNLLQGYKKVIEDLSAKLRQKD